MMSIQRRLLLSLIAVLVAGIAVTGFVVYRQSRDEANALFDFQLRQLAASLPVRAFGALAPQAAGVMNADEDVVIRIWNRFGLFVYSSHPDVPLPMRTQLGFSTVATPAGDWRVFAVLVDDDVVEVAQPMRVRRSLAAEVALRTVMPLLVLLPVLAILLWFVVGRGLAPLRRVAREVTARNPAALDPLGKESLPEEIEPLADALNQLLARLAQALETQRAFIADAAHELRTPITALQLQLQVAERAVDATTREASLAALRGGLARIGHLVEQLLALARTEPDAGGATMQRVDLHALARDVVARHTTLAIARGIDLGVDEPPHDPNAPQNRHAAEDSGVEGDPDALATLLSNLVDNALRYTPRGGKVDVAVGRDATDSVVLAVRDSGPGIAADERERVFDRFHRGTAARAAGDSTGSGLGLAIVARIAERHGARVVLADHLVGHRDRAGGAGLAVEVRFPREGRLPQVADSIVR